jgi:hypothetical protein
MENNGIGRPLIYIYQLGDVFRRDISTVYFHQFLPCSFWLFFGIVIINICASINSMLAVVLRLLCLPDKIAKPRTALAPLQDAKEGFLLVVEFIHYENNCQVESFVC